MYAVIASGGKQYRVQEGAIVRKVLVLADQQGKELRIGLNEIEQRRTSGESLMPANVTEPLSAADFGNLLAYLLSLTSSGTGH